MSICFMIVGIIKTPASETTEFTMSSEDFPALPGTQNNDSNISAGSGSETKVSNTSATSSTVTNSNLNLNKRGLQISTDGKVSNHLRFPATLFIFFAAFIQLFQFLCAIQILWNPSFYVKF